MSIDIYFKTGLKINEKRAASDEATLLIIFLNPKY